MDSKVVTAPKTESQSKDKDKFNKKDQRVKVNIIKPESFTQFKFSRIDSYQGRVLFAL